MRLLGAEEEILSKAEWAWLHRDQIKSFYWTICLNQTQDTIMCVCAEGLRVLLGRINTSMSVIYLALESRYTFPWKKPQSS